MAKNGKSLACVPRILQLDSFLAVAEAVSQSFQTVKGTSGGGNVQASLWMQESLRNLSCQMVACMSHVSPVSMGSPISGRDDEMAYYGPFHPTSKTSVAVMGVKREGD
ncbi:uncharacterized protein MYCGRDRAFT_90122 [Zymoseptoria tritici IPO323]|uniref:Uncharacterized protein n=1 Tax=Zymoseptoria tritici (strain CBS 115943 / IPO323) TaxID=336722 RepID=F9WYL7_ZYMTI|nr:uncharacterized protein MYCGRDRAFT_90122 [Zymoseptoria tritici IPO323]EGP91700.1 hypothetical protein MYCGRDRAFT_90122 [Zymoseptoria tritici IPO323]